jgi:hypothetical protein
MPKLSSDDRIFEAGLKIVSAQRRVRGGFGAER